MTRSKFSKPVDRVLVSLLRGQSLDFYPSERGSGGSLFWRRLPRPGERFVKGPKPKYEVAFETVDRLLVEGLVGTLVRRVPVRPVPVRLTEEGERVARELVR